MKNRSVKALSLVFVLAILLSAVLPMSVNGDNGISESFITSLVKEGSATPEFEVTSAVYENISAKSGWDDLAKTYMLTGAPTGKLSSGVQTFENGKYSDGAFVPDHKALAKYITRALEIYSENESGFSEHERMRARSVISYAFEKLAMNERLKVENAPYWLTGADHRDLYILEYVEESYIRVNTNGFFTAFSPDDLENSENYTRKIRKDANPYSHGLLFDIYETNELRISVPRDALHFSAAISSDLRDIEVDYETARLTVYLTDSEGSEYEFAEYLFYKGYENRIDIPLDGAQSIRFSFSCDAKLEMLGCVLGDGVFLCDDDDPSSGSGYALERLGDVNRDGVVNKRDLDDISQVILGNIKQDLSTCDTDKNGQIDLGDMLCLRNYLIMVGNTDKEYNKERSSFSVVALGDSIARGCGLANAESVYSSANAYGALTAAYIEKATGYNVSFNN